jgi:3'-5' exonuclease
MSAPLPDRPRAPLLVFDIETVPDVDLLTQVYAIPAAYEDAALLPDHWKNRSLAEAILKEAQINFPAPMFHAVVSICAVYVHPETFTIMDGFRRSVPLSTSLQEFRKQEKELLVDFWNFCLKHKDVGRIWYDKLMSDSRLTPFERKKLKPVPVTFCGFNVSGFDLPVIELRSMKYLLRCPIEDYGKDTGYDSYRSKFAPDKTFDLCQYLGWGGTRPSLESVSRAIGLGGKMKGMDGSLVASSYYDEGAIAKIEEYCAVDVLITYGVYLAVQKFRGFIDSEEFDAARVHFEKFLRAEGRPAVYRELADASADFWR